MANSSLNMAKSPLISIRKIGEASIVWLSTQKLHGQCFFRSGGRMVLVNLYVVRDLLLPMIRDRFFDPMADPIADPMADVNGWCQWLMSMTGSSGDCFLLNLIYLQDLVGFRSASNTWSKILRSPANMAWKCRMKLERQHTSSWTVSCHVMKFVGAKNIYPLVN